MARTRPRPSRPVKVALPRGGDPEAFLDAAYELIAAAWVRLDGDAKRPAARLAPRPGTPGAGLAEAFRAAYEEARRRRERAGAGLALEAAVLARALELADNVEARRREPEAALPLERREKIARLLAEAEAAPTDPLGIAPTWEQLRRGGRP